jgi:hypothetical protein
MRQILFFIVVVFAFASCNKNKIDPDPGKPVAVKLLFPHENMLCNVGTDSTATESNVQFEWSKGENADEYQLILKNLISGDSIARTTPDIKLTLRILRSTPFAWYVLSISKSASETARSETWMFYNAGEAIENYAPFPAEIISPKMAETIAYTSGTISLVWTGNDIDGDITGYDVYFGTSNPPVLIQTNVQASMLNNVAVLPNTTYYWNIITKDARGNSSGSGIYQFRIK